MNNINYEKLADKLHEILEYDNGNNGRPEDICEELMFDYGDYYKGIVYHGACCHTADDVRRNYYGFVSCSYDKEIAESFAQSYYSDTQDEEGVIFQVDITNVLALDVQKLINDCYKNCPNNELCKYLYDSYNSENEILVYFEDIQDSIEFIS